MQSHVKYCEYMNVLGWKWPDLNLHVLIIMLLFYLFIYLACLVFFWTCDDSGHIPTNISSLMQLRPVPHFCAGPVVFDPNTVSPWLHLNDDLTSVNENSERLTAPDNPERFDPCVFVLGAEGYTSGKHKWEVVVGANPSWIVGVCKKTVARKKKFTLSTNRGVWCIGLSKGVYTAFTNERTELQVQERPERIRIKLNMDTGEVSFWNGGTAKHLITLRHKFDEEMFPFFGPGLHSEPVTLVQGKIAVHTS